LKIGVVVPQGWAGEYAGFTSDAAWARTTAVAAQAETLGFESIWLFDHFHTVPDPTDELTSRVRLGHLVLCSGYRNPALVAKMAGTLDVISGGRFEIGIGAGWKEDEWRAYGYGFPPLRDRLAHLDESVKILDRMLRPGHADFAGRFVTVADAINLPKGLQSPRIPIMIGGNGPEVTWRIAARQADELNLDGLSPDETRAALPVIASRCEEVDRDPATLRISVHVNWPDAARAGERRREMLSAYRDLGVARVMLFLRRAAKGDEALEVLADDARAIGLPLA